MKQQYSYIACLHPQRIYNKYIQDYIIVECGHCYACLTRKASRNALKCQLESQSHKYTMFVTLTYNQISIPLMRSNCTRFGDYQSDLIELCPRLGVGTILGECDLPPFERMNLLKKCQTFNLFPHLSKRDLQLFIKRLRKYISKYSNEKIRYYAVGEYGPVHFRPHYHLELWFSDDKIYKIIQQAIFSCWKYGRVSAEVSRGSSARYVAGYINNFVCIPRIFGQGQTKPFNLHSHHLGESVLEKAKEEVYASSAKDFIERSFNFGTGDFSFNLWRSFKTYYFPKCKGYASCTDEQLYYIYRIALEVGFWTKSANMAASARYILRTIKGVHRVFGNSQQFHQDPDINDMLKFFADSCDINPVSDIMDSEYFQRIYSIIRLSNHFLRFCCDGDTRPETSWKMIRRIQDFWNECEALNLVTQLEAQESLDFDDSDDYKFFYHNTDDFEELVKKTKQYRIFSAQCQERYNRSIKHKHLNDLNKIFLK